MSQKMNPYPLLLMLILALCHFTPESYSQDRIPVILDADTGNEVDDLYAVARALIEPQWNILSLNAAQWQTSHWTEAQSMENSYRLNAVILGHMDLNVKTRRGGHARMYDWGDQAQHSAAAYEIIKQAKALPGDQKLTVIALGALTNVASAIYIDPAIESKIKLYWLGTTYDFETNILKKHDFNCIMDVQALEVLLSSDVEMVVMPHSTALAMEFSYAETEDRLQGKHPLGDYLVDRWYNHLDGLRKKRWIWDLALIEAMVHPEWTEQVKITTSKENGSKELTLYKSIDGKKSIAEFFDKMDAFFESKASD